MRVERLRPLPSPDELAAMYPAPHDHFLYGRGHGERVDATIALAKAALSRPFLPAQIADLSCGNGHIARSIARHGDGLHLGDIAMDASPDTFDGCVLYVGPIEETIRELPEVDTFICSETIEHLDNPAMVLAAVRRTARQLVLSTPLDCWEDTNSEHLWAWDRDHVEMLMLQCNWHVEAFTSVDSREYGEPYLYGIWVAS